MSDREHEFLYLRITHSWY